MSVRHTKLKIRNKKQGLNIIQILGAETGKKRFAIIWHWRIDEMKGTSSSRRLKEDIWKASRKIVLSQN